MAIRTNGFAELEGAAAAVLTGAGVAEGADCSCWLLLGIVGTTKGTSSGEGEGLTAVEGAGATGLAPSAIGCGLRGIVCVALSLLFSCRIYSLNKKYNGVKKKEKTQTKPLPTKTIT